MKKVFTESHRSVEMSPRVIAPILIGAVLSSFVACSSRPIEPEIGPGQKAGQYVDGAWERAKRGTAHSYDKSKEWVRTTSDRFSRGVSGFGRSWSGESSRSTLDESDEYGHDADGRYDYQADNYSNNPDSYRYDSRDSRDGNNRPEPEVPRTDNGDSRY